LAAKGAQAAGAGLVRLVVDPAIRDTLAVSAGGVMVATIEEAASAHRFAPDCVLAGPGWGRGEDRLKKIAELASEEHAGLALVLDADAVSLARGLRFNGNAILTPHPGELSEYLGIAKDTLLASPDSYLCDAASSANAVIVLKGHVTRIASGDGRIAVIDGMEPVLAMGGSGDVLAGLTAAIASRVVRARRAENRPFDAFPVAAAASALLAEAGRTAGREIGFCDPADIARIAGRLAATAWLWRDPYGK
jgi:NAD(P)H-hydrate epimerase